MLTAEQLAQCVQRLLVAFAAPEFGSQVAQLPTRAGRLGLLRQARQAVLAQVEGGPVSESDFEAAMGAHDAPDETRQLILSLEVVWQALQRPALPTRNLPEMQMAQVEREARRRLA